MILSRLIESPAWRNSSDAHKAVLVVLMARADHDEYTIWVPEEGRQITIEPGMALLSQSEWSQQSETSTNTVRYAKQRLIEQGCIEEIATYQCGTLIQIQEWEQLADEKPPPESNPSGASPDDGHRREPAAPAAHHATYDHTTEMAEDPLESMPRPEDDFDANAIIERAVQTYRDVWDVPHYTARPQVKNRIVARYREWHESVDQPVVSVIRHAWDMRTDLSCRSLHGFVSPAQFEQILMDCETQEVGIDTDVINDVVSHYKTVFDQDKVRVTTNTQHQIMRCWEQGQQHSDTPVRDAIDRARHLMDVTNDTFWRTNSSLHDITQERIFDKLLSGHLNASSEGAEDTVDEAQRLRQMIHGSESNNKDSIREEAEDVF